MIAKNKLIKKKKVLLVEDHPLLRAMLVQLIERELAMTVCGQADNIREALRLIEQTHPSAVIVDITLNGSSGLELLKNLKRRHNPPAVLVLSGHEEHHYAELALDAGAKGFVSKRAEPATVVAAIRAVMAGQIYLSEDLTREIREGPGQADKAFGTLRVDLLSDREVEVLRLVGRGLNSREIAGHLKLGLATVDSDRVRIRAKLGIKGPAELYQRAAQWVARSR